VSDRSAFQQEVERDVSDVFLNLDDFGEIHEVEGSEITVVIAPAESIELSGGYAIGLSTGQIVLYAKTDDLPAHKASGSIINIDGTEYVVNDRGDDGGMSKVTLTKRGTF
jgi:hypothetical protein